MPRIGCSVAEADACSNQFISAAGVRCASRQVIEELLWAAT